MCLLTLVVPILIGYVSYTAFQQTKKRTNLPALPHQSVPQPQYLDQILTLSAASGPIIIRKSVRIPYEDRHAFREHLKAAGMQKAWFTQDGHSYNILITMPKEEAHELDAIQTHPIRWITNERTRANHINQRDILIPVKAAIHVEITGATNIKW